MELLRWKTIISVLWIILVVNFATHVILNLLGSGMTKALLEGQISDQTRFMGAILFFIPCLMAWLPFVLKEAANRWTSFVVGILFALIKIGVLITGFAGARSSTAVVFNLLWGIVAAALVAWYAWKMPKREA